MTIADDLRAVAQTIAMYGMDDDAARLRAHAETIERIEREMCGWRWEPACTPSVVMREWANALRGDKQ